MRVMVVGSGAREHALAWRLGRDPEVTTVYVAPGNAGSHAVATAVDLSVPADDGAVEEFARATQNCNIDLVVVGPEAPLVAGLVDALSAQGVRAFGPSRAAARLEGSKAFSKEFMARHGIPTAPFRIFDDADEAKGYVRSQNRPLVVKADGLAAGKGVTVATTPEEATSAIDAIMVTRKFGRAGDRVVVEDTLSGQEISYHVVADGTRYVALAPAQDHKRAFDGDRGPNTGGMGAYSPPPFVTPELEARIREEVVEPTLEGMSREGTPFRGALFIGLMVDAEGPQVLEYNVRFGDPECECLVTRLGGSFASLLDGSARGDLSGFVPVWEAPCSMTVVLASGGYPGPYERGLPIEGLDALGRENVWVFHAGTARDGDRYVTSGGRVLAITAVGTSLPEVSRAAYGAADTIVFEGKHLRRDIGSRAVESA